MKTSCVILNYNDAATTLKLLNAIKDYHELDYVVVVDNNSQDDSYSVLKSHANDKVHILSTERNGGYGYGNNRGIRYSYDVLKVDLILIANPDVEFTETCLRALKASLLDDARAAACSAVPREANGERSKTIAWKIPDTVNQEILSNSAVYSKVFGGRDLYDEAYFAGKEICPVDAVPGSMLLVKADVMVKYGMYDEEVFLYGEEKILGYKFKEAHYSTLLLMNQYYVHYHSVTIQRNYKSLMNIKKIGLDSEIVILRKYWGLEGIKLTAAKMFLMLLFMERVLIAKVREAKVI